MADTYLDISEIADDANMQRRVSACAAQQTKLEGMLDVGDPTSWTVYHRLTWASSPSWGEKWAYAKLTHEDNPSYKPGADSSVITDGDILATIQPLLIAPEPPPAPNPMMFAVPVGPPPPIITD